MGVDAFIEKLELLLDRKLNIRNLDPKKDK
jgi:hypothetical protein